MIIRPLSLTLVLGMASTAAFAAPVTPTDLDVLPRGGTIVGPVGPTVNASIINDDGQSIADIIGQVDCPAGVDPCVPPENAPGTIYTFIYQITPGQDSENDVPFQPNPEVTDFDGVASFELGFRAEGFNGVAGYSFADVDAAFDTDGLFQIEFDEDTGNIIWTATSDNDWDSGESISFFFQTTQPPLGPGQGFVLTGEDGSSGTGIGPVPTPVQSVPAPNALTLLGLGVVGLIGAAHFGRRKRQK